VEHSHLQVVSPALIHRQVGWGQLASIGSGLSGEAFPMLRQMGDCLYRRAFLFGEQGCQSYSTGNYLTANNVAGWNGQWFPLGSGANVGGMAPFGPLKRKGNVYVGSFVHYGGW
jgi:hypothetical protein